MIYVLLIIAFYLYIFNKNEKSNTIVIVLCFLAGAILLTKPFLNNQNNVEYYNVKKIVAENNVLHIHTNDTIFNIPDSLIIHNDMNNFYIHYNSDNIWWYVLTLQNTKKIDKFYLYHEN